MLLLATHFNIESYSLKHDHEMMKARNVTWERFCCVLGPLVHQNRPRVRFRAVYIGFSIRFRATNMLVYKIQYLIVINMFTA